MKLFFEFRNSLGLQQNEIVTLDVKHLKAKYAIKFVG